MTLKELRQQSEKSIAEVAKALSLTDGAIRHYESGIREIGLEHVLTLAKLFDCTEREVIEAQLKSIAIRLSD